MDLHKIHHPDNFDFVVRVGGKGRKRAARTGTRPVDVSLRDLGNDVFRLEFAERPHRKRRCLYELDETFGGKSRYRLELRTGGALELRPGEGHVGPSLVGPSGGSLGFSGSAWMIRFVSGERDRFFGMGEKWGPLEKSRRTSQFWTTDIWADFSPEEIGNADIDCTYAVVPYLIIEREGAYFGMLLDCPFPSFIATNPILSLTGEDPFRGADLGAPGDPSGPGLGYLYGGASAGAAIVYLLVGPTLRELTAKLQHLVGTTPRPPLWALGHHQSRWGYADQADLEELDREFAAREIPCDGLWLDIDYMDGYRVFTTKPGAFEERNDGSGAFDFSALWARRRRIVPILDPGIKVESGYRVCDQAMSGGHFCLGPTGKPYVGIVWPGRTYFPDFSQRRSRAFWASEVAAFARRGFDGFWIDMNDPATGPVENRSMLFSQGKYPHEAFHNQYALGMAQATHQGLLLARPDERPFVLSRSAFTTMGRHSAVWTGDNISSFRHLAVSIPTSLNLGLSGIPFNGPDVPGFGGDATPELAVRFYQAIFLFPFLRNHSVQSARPQEPWALGDEALEHIRHYIRLRYRFLPYLYQLFIRHEASGDLILAPLFVDEPRSGNLQRADDQFFVGALLCAPVVDVAEQRMVELPTGRFFDLRSARWCSGGRTAHEVVPLGECPLYVRGSSLLYLNAQDTLLAPDGGTAHPQRRLTEIEVHVFLESGAEVLDTYVYDDGESLAYRRGEERRVAFAVVRAGTKVHVQVAVEGSAGAPATNLAPLGVRFVLYGMKEASLFVQGERVPVTEASERFSGQELPVFVSENIRL